MIRSVPGRRGSGGAMRRAGRVVSERCLVLVGRAADEVLAGGSLVPRLAASGTTIRVVTLSASSPSDDAERAIRREILALRPDTVLVPSPLDASSDHRAVFYALHAVLTPLRARTGDTDLAGLAVLVYDVGPTGVPGTRRYPTSLRELRLDDFTTRSGAQLVQWLGGAPDVPEMRTGPRISVVVRTKDRPELLAEALTSIAATRYRAAEVVLVNDGGATPVVPEAFPLPVVRVELDTNSGRAAAAQAGIAAATGAAVTFLDDDDVVAPEHLSTLANLISRPHVSVAYTDAAVGIYERDARGWVCRDRQLPYSRDFDPDVLTVDNYIPFNTLVIERWLFEETGPFDTSLPFFEDWDYLIRLAERARFHHLARVTCEYRHFRDSADQVFGEHPRDRPDFLAVKARVLHKHATRRGGESLARAVDTLRAEAVAASARAEYERRRTSRSAVVRRPASAIRRAQLARPVSPTERATTNRVRTRVALVCSEPVRPRMAGIGIRFGELARRLPDHGIDVVLVSPEAPEVMETVVPGTPVVRFERAALAAQLAGCDAAVVQGQLADDLLRECPGLPTAIDLSDPWLVEHLAYAPSLGHGLVARDTASLVIQMSRGDFFLCSSEEQRTFYLGFLAAVGRLDPQRYATDPQFSQLIAPVPFGVPDAVPAHRQYLPDRRPGERRLLFGGLYDWYDPWTVLEALAALDRPEVTLLFVANPNPETTPQRLLAEVEERCRSIGWWGSRVHLLDWVPADRRWDLFRDVDALVSPHCAGIESHLSMRTRVLDALVAGCPVVTTEGGAASRLLSEHRTGWLVRASDAAGLAAAIAEILDDPVAVDERLANTDKLLSNYRWDHVLEPLIAFCRQPRVDATKAQLVPSSSIGAWLDQVVTQTRTRLGMAWHGAGSAVHR